MRVLRIKAQSMIEALAEARKQLGDDAKVLHTRLCEDRRWLGLGRRYGIEVLAAADTSLHVPRLRLAAAPRPVSAQGNLEDVARQLAEVRRALARLDSKREALAPKAPAPAVARLVRNGVSEGLAEVALGESQSSAEAGEVLKHIAPRIRCTGDIDCDRSQARVALVGVTGAGKTTTAAKLAAQYAISRKKKVALLTLDTYRVGAIEQIGAYARMLDLPIEVALSPEDVDGLVRRHEDKDLIIIDTVGRSQRKREHLAELETFLRQARPTETHLVVSASADAAAQREAVDAFRPLCADRLILTKLDECPRLGCILDLAATSLLPFSYITYGQEVPDDIAVADPDRLSSLVWEGTL